MFKKQALGFLVAALALVGGAQALGLGDIELNSNLNEPLDARIELVEPRDLSASEIIPTLASRDAFEQAGIERNFFLSNIRFDVQPTASGGLVVQLSTSGAVREPFLNFLVEVNWPGGRLLKEYTLLLDPPVFDSEGAGESDLVEPATESGNVGAVTPPPPAEPQAPETTRYQVVRDDTLWEIALRVEAGDGYLPQQVMLAIQDLNPDAFINNNINRVRAGEILNLPSEAQIALRSAQQAITEVGVQNQAAGLTVNGRPPSEVQLSATETTSSALAQDEGERNPDGYLEVTTDDETEGSSAGGDVGADAEIERLENELAIAGELNDQFERESEAMEARLAELEEQLQIMQRMLSLQSGDAANLQSELADLEQQATEQLAAERAEQNEPSNPIQPLLDFLQPVIDWIMQSQRNMIIAGAVALLLLVLPSFIHSRSRKAREAAEGRDDSGADVDEDSADEAAEAIREAEMYLAYNNYDRAEDTLKAALDEEPERSDLGLKLLEVYAAAGDAEAFDDLADRLPLTSEERDQVYEMRERFADDFDDVDDDELGLGMLDDAPPAPSTRTTLDDLEDELNAATDELDLGDFDADVADDAVDTSDDFNLDINDLEDVGSDDKSGGGLDFDLSDLGLGEETDAESLAGNDLDFDMDEGSAPAGDLDDEPVEPPPTLAEDEDVDFDFTDLDVGDETDTPDDGDALPEGADLEEDEYDFLSGADEASTKLDLARAYLEMEDAEGARDILEEVLAEGNDEQKNQAQELLGRL